MAAIMDDAFEPFADNIFLNVVHVDDAQPPQIVATPTTTDQLIGPRTQSDPEDVQDFDKDVDASFLGVHADTIDPSLLLPHCYQQFPYTPFVPFVPSRADAATDSSLSTSGYTDATSPPTSPEYIEEPPEDDTSLGLGSHLPEDQLLALAEYVRAYYDSSGGDPTVEGSQADPGRPSLSPHEPTATTPTYLYPAPVPGSGHEHTQERYFGAAAADSPGQGIDMQVHPDNIITSDLQAGGRMPPSDETRFLTQTDAFPVPLEPARRKKTKTTPVQRKQSKEKKFRCPEGCGLVSARSYNIRKHIDEKHRGIRPFRCPVDGCSKFSEGYFRKGDLKKHLTSRHPDYGGGPFDTVRSATSCQCGIWLAFRRLLEQVCVSLVRANLRLLGVGGPKFHPCVTDQ
ncbi:hypothetical protein BD414DRAFT_495978 [Trametes punicea]|nr:hypothetical protein BD414DRAFT_495978 [Trametes punicea]